MADLLALEDPIELADAPLPPRRDGVVLLSGHAPAGGHDAVAKASLAASLARLLGTEWVGSGEDEATKLHRPYFVPCDTLLAHRARSLGIGSWGDLFGGVAPSPVVATKAITHGLVAPAARAPQGWSEVFASCVENVVLEGWSVFHASDARRACQWLLRGGAVRVKDAAGVGGAGQVVVHDMAGLDAALAAIDELRLARDGLVLERNLNQARTCSVGQVRVGGWLLSYHGQQRLTHNHHGAEVYGGSTLHLVRGDFEVLLRQPMDQETRTAVDQALVYHRVAMNCFPGLIASRCNYDIVQGLDDAGVWRSGVLEQSWRIGGASGAEIAALHAWAETPSLRWVRASTHELYGHAVSAPADAQVHYDGVDPVVGRLLKYATVEARGNA
jgi:hypothetical protein